MCVAEPAAGCVAIVKRINMLLLNIQKTKTMASGPITSWQNRWGNNGNSDRLFWGGGPPKSLHMVTAAMKLKDACSLEEKL